MKLSGNNFLSISTQTGISFNLDLSIDNITGNCNFGFSGENKDLTFRLNKGNIIDPSNQIVYSYNSNELINISGNLDLNLYSYYINEQPCVLNGPKDLFNISGFYLNTQNCSADLDLSLYGNVPNYGVDFSNTFYITGNNPLIGIISNSGDSTFKIFSGVITAPTGFSVNGFILNGTPVNNTAEINNTTFGQISISHYYQTFSQIENSRLYNIQLDLYTNFGKVSKTIPITGSLSGYINIDLNTLDIIYPSSQSLIGSEDETNILLNNKIITGSKSIELELDKNLNIKLEYHGGKTGIFYADVPGSGYKSVNVSGFLNGSGYLGKTDLILTGYNLQSGSQITGYMTGVPSEQFIVTGYTTKAINNTTVTGYYFNNQYVTTLQTYITGYSSNGTINYNDYVYPLNRRRFSTVSTVSVPNTLDFFNSSIESNESGTISLVSLPYESNHSLGIFSTGRVFVYTGHNSGGGLRLARTYSGLNGDRSFGSVIYKSQTGDLFLIGSERRGSQGDSGRFYVCENYTQDLNSAKLINFSGQNFTSNCHGVIIGDIVCIGIGSSFNNTGSVNIYENTGTILSLRQTLTGYSNGGRFGKSLAINQNKEILSVSARLANNTGEVYIFTGNNFNYNLLNKLHRSGEAGYPFLGSLDSSMSFNKVGNLFAIGGWANGNYPEGIFYIFTGDKNSNFKQVYYATGSTSAGQLGSRVKFNSSGDKLLVNNLLGSLYGNIYTGANTNWILYNTIQGGNIAGKMDISTLPNNEEIYYRLQSNSIDTIYNINYSGYFSGTQIATGIINKTSNYLITGLITGNKYNKTFSNTFNLITGYYLPSSGTYTGFFDFKQNNLLSFDGKSYSNSNPLIPTGINDFYVKVKTKNYYDDEAITGKLTVVSSTFNGSNTGVIYYYITGKKV